MNQRIGLVVTLGERGGAQVFLLGFARWLKEHAYTPVLIAGDGDWLEEQAKVDGIEYHRVMALGREISLVRDARALSELTQLFKKLQLDAVHLNSSKMGSLGALAAKKAGMTRSVYCIAGWAFLEPMSSFKRFLFQWIEKVTASWKDAIICLHPGDVATAKSLGITPRMFLTIPNGVDAAQIQARLLSRKEACVRLSDFCQTSFTISTPLIGTIANFFPAKDLVRYMETCALVHKVLPFARFVILGDGMLRHAIEAERKRFGLEEIVFLPGAIDHASDLLSAFDVYCLPSSKEGMSLSILEAMAAGIATVVTDVGANRWMLDGHGWVVPPQDPATLAGTLLEAMTDEGARIQKAMNAQAHVRQVFSAENMYQQHLDSLHLD